LARLSIRQSVVMKDLHALAAAVAALGLIVSGSAEAADAQAGRRQKVIICQACHGFDGLSKNPESPNLAGQIESYLVKALNEYRNETRKNDTMNIVAKDLTDEEIANVAAFYAAIQVEVIPP
jgi:cytochrome c553